MRVLRFLQISLATVVAVTTTLSTSLIGCVTKAKDTGPPGRGVVCDPVPPPPQRSWADMVHPTFNNVLFANDKAAIRPESRAEIDKVCANLNEHPKDTVIVEGHTSDTGTPAHNLALGLRRAEAVKAYMVEQGIAPDRIQTKSLGSSKPAVPNDTPANRKLNSRVTFSYTFGE